MFKIKFSYVVLLICVMILSCSTYRNNLIANGDENQAIENAIIDFSNTNRLYRKHQVFQVEFIDTLYRKVHKKIDERNFQWIDGKPYEGIIAINIVPMTNEFTYLVSDSLNLPSRYIENKGKLFFWKDREHKVSDEIIEILNKYKVVSEEELNPIFVIHESQKAVDYYMCRKDFTKYKKVMTNIAIGYYDAPEVECDK